MMGTGCRIEKEMSVRNMWEVNSSHTWQLQTAGVTRDVTHTHTASKTATDL